MKTWSLLVLFAAYGCDGKNDTETNQDASMNTDDPDEGGSDMVDDVTLDTCRQSYADGVPYFYSKYFACVDVSMDGDAVNMWTDGLPPTPSPYYNENHPNYVEFDDRGGTHAKNPGELAEQDFSMSVPLEPTPKGFEVTVDMVDTTMNTNDEEYSAGGVGVSLNGVLAFAAMAGPGDVLADEQYTFDLYEGHPAGDQYHYHFNTKGPLEVLVDRGLSNNAGIGQGTVEMYALMCDGTVVMGCTELDGSEPHDHDFDAQNGHVHDLADEEGVTLENRYHTHVCVSKWPDYIFFPEIAYYEETGCSAPAGGGDGGGPPGGGPPPGK